MAEHGLVTLDPVRLAGLESYLAGLGDGCARGAGAVIDDLAGTGASAPGEVAELGRIAEWCRTQADGVVRRRRILEGLPAALPWPDFAFSSRAEARERADVVARDLRRALDAEEPSWPALQRLLADVARGAHSPTFMAGVCDELGLAYRRALPVVVELSHRDVVPDPPSRPGGSSTDPELVAARSVALRLAPPEPDSGSGRRRPAVEVPSSAGPGGAVAAVNHALDLDLDDEAIADIERAGRDVGLATDVVSGVVKALRALKDSKVRGLGPLAVVGLLMDIPAAISDPDDVNVLSLTSSGFAVAAPATGVAAPVLYLASAVLAFCAWAVTTARDTDDREVRRYNEGTGETTYPSGSDDNPNVGVAGVPTRFG
ncbi:hypothetical protein [Iamia sp.]|uniref:hypothetical protein n=1 Tax=Iamia sp. TaxID=2722710 RepID=UPI002D0E6EA3|nr:hypothetical protein [Iamia sp.]HXH56676.1 hypothetical protein [Iamia sp.]